ncbi:MAG TPA: nucleotidyl transferase AbiEii/AbiGii toxin family protein [Thermoanaerobaculia bacterium]|nr:nucleotidyl transferase AbiEii/AbiGii toxin family protein [Thermoanaerobaculia bacterium]
MQEVIFSFCADRPDVTVFGAQAVNLYTRVPRMSEDVDLLASDPAAAAEALAGRLGEELHVATRVREIRAGVAYRVFQVRKEGDRHLADVRLRMPLGETTVRDGIRYVSLVDLVAMKVLALSARGSAPKGATDLADLRRLLLSHPEIRSSEAGVTDTIRRFGGSVHAVEAWAELLAAPLVSDEDADEGY